MLEFSLNSMFKGKKDHEEGDMVMVMITVMVTLFIHGRAEGILLCNM